MDNQIWILLLILIPTGWFFLRVQRALNSPLNEAPGPFYTLLSDLYLMAKEFSGERRSYIHSLHQKYGPVVRLGPNEVSFTSVEAVKEIYTSGGSGYDKTEFYTLFMQFGTRTMFSTLGKGEHGAKKRSVAGAYANSNIMHADVIKGIRERTDAFLKKCAAGTVDVYVWLHCFALDCASLHLFGSYGTRSFEGKGDLKMMEEQSYHNSLQENLAQYRWPALSWLFNLVLNPRPSPIANSYVLDCVKKSDPGEHTLLYRLQNSKGALEEIEIAAECMDHLAAGIDTTGDALCFLMHHLSQPSSQSIQESLISELQSNPNNSLDELPYLDAVIKESLRCFPPIPMSQPRYVPSGGRIIDGYVIPAGTIVSCQAWSVHRLNEDIFPDGEVFRPERWMATEKVVDMNRVFLAFGAGGRGCIGRHLAMAEMRVLLRGVYSRFRTRIAPDMKGRMDLSDQVISSRPLDQTCKLVFEPIK